MRVTLLGTGGSAGVPLIGGKDGSGDWGLCDPAEPRNRRTRSSIVLENPKNQRLLVDTGPDMRAQFLACRIRGADAILYTHAHADHVTGLDDVRILNRIAGRPLEAFATQQTLDEIKMRFGYALTPWDGSGFYRPVLVGKPVSPGDMVQMAGFDVRLFAQAHGRIDTLGLRTGAFGYSTDVAELDDAAFEVLDGVDTWVVGCFLRHDYHWTHANLDKVLSWVERLRPRRTVLTHMGIEMDWSWLRTNLPSGVEPGYDGMTLDVDDTAT